MNRLLIAALVVIVLALGVFFALRSEETVTTSEDRPSPLTKIDTAEVTKIVLEGNVGKGEDRHKQYIVLTRGEAEGDSDPVWNMEEPVKTDAHQQAVKTLLEKVGSLRVIDVASEMATSHEDLEVTENTGIRVQVFGGEDRIAHYIVGKSTGGNTMLRLPDQDIVYRVQGSLRYVFGKRTADWRDKRVFDLERDQIGWIELRNETGVYAFARDISEDDSEWTMESIDAVAPPPEEEEEEEEEGDSKAKTKRPPAKAPAKAAPERVTTIERFDQAKVRSIVTSLARLRCTDFHDGDVEEEMGFEDDGQTRVSFRVGRGDNAKTYVLLVGHQRDDRSNYARREDADQVYLLTKHMAKRFHVDATSFQKRRPGEPGKAPPSLGGGGMPFGPGGMPGGMPGGGMPFGPGGSKIPPEMLKAAQEQMMRQKLLKQLAEQAEQGQ